MSEMKRTVETTGSDVEEAVAAGLEELQVDRDAVNIEILDEGSRGVFGLGAREASVRLTVKAQPAQPAPPEAARPVEPEKAQAPRPEAPPPMPPGDEPDMAEPGQEESEKDQAEIAREALLELLAMMGFEDVQMDVRKAEAAPGEKNVPLVYDVRGPDVSALIGRRGETLAALQHITRLIVGQETASWVNLILDVDGYKAQRAESLRGLAGRLAEQAVRTNRRVVLEPMPPHERRVVHLALRDHPQVTTESIGQGDRRKVTIIPK
jgi:spoIIIJ-associated protein